LKQLIENRQRSQQNRAFCRAAADQVSQLGSAWWLV